MTTTEVAQYAVLLVAAAAGHGAMLRFAVRLMVNVPIGMRLAYGIVAAEYVVAGLLAAAGHMLAAEGAWQVPAILAFAGLVATGAVLVGRRVALPGGHPVGVGNGVLIQFMQVPMVIPFAILLSFLVVPPL